MTKRLCKPDLARLLCCGLFACLVLIKGSYGAKSGEEWRSRSIYQVLTDRFAGGGGCSDLSSYCGGTFNGLRKQLDYITALGFDAIWISPVIENTPGGYHGYWAKDLYAINPEFGTKAELKALIKAAHAKDIWIMVDVVANHMGYTPKEGDFSGFNPFDSPEHYNGCESCPDGCNIKDFTNDLEVEVCRLAGLPDLDQGHPFVREELLKWIEELVEEYDFDGIRVDTVPEVAKDFWAEFAEAGGCFSIGEAFDGDIGKVAKYEGDALDSMLHYPMYFTLRDCFMRGDSLTRIEGMRQMTDDAFSDASVLGLFLDNHDNARFLHDQKDQALYRNALAYVLLGEGIPIVYYGTEQAFAGGNDPNNREALWPTNFAEDTPMFQFVATLNKHRMKAKIWEQEQQEVYMSDNCYAFVRGDTLVVLTNAGSEASDTVCELFWPELFPAGTQYSVVYPNTKAGTPVAVNGEGKFPINLWGGEPVVLTKGKISAGHGTDRATRAGTAKPGHSQTTTTGSPEATPAEDQTSGGHTSGGDDGTPSGAHLPPKPTGGHSSGGHDESPAGADSGKPVWVHTGGDGLPPGVFDEHDQDDETVPQGQEEGDDDDDDDDDSSFTGSHTFSGYSSGGHTTRVTQSGPLGFLGLGRKAF